MRSWRISGGCWPSKDVYIDCKGKTVQRMPESNLSRASKQCCHLLSAYRERGKHSQRTPSQRTLRRGALAMLVRNNGPGLKKTSLYASRAAALLPGDQNIYHPLMRVSAFSASIAVKTLELTHLHDAQPLLHFNTSTLSYTGCYRQGPHAWGDTSDSSSS